MPQIQYQQIAQPVPFAPFAETVTESRWHQPWSEPVRFKQDSRASIALAASSGNTLWPFPLPNSDPGQIVTDYFAPFSGPVRFPARLTTGAQKADWLTEAAPFPEIVSYDRWNYPWSEPVRLKPDLGAARQQFQPQNPFGQTQPERVSYDKWNYPWSEPVRLKPDLGASRQQFLQFQLPGSIPEAVLYSKFNYPWSEPVRFKPRLGAGLNPFTAQVHAPPYPESVTEDRWHQPWSEPVRFKPRLLEGSQLAFTFHPTPSPFSPWGWFNWFSEPVRVKPMLRAALQSSYTGPVNVTVPVTSPLVWYAPFSEPVRFKPGLKAGLQMSFTMVLAPPTQVNRGRTLINVVIRTRILSNESGRNSG